MVFQPLPDGDGLDEPVLSDHRSPGSAVTRRVALELMESSGSQSKFAAALSKRLGRVVSRKTARTIIRAVAPFTRKGARKVK